MTRPELLIANPLPSALHHYGRELAETLERIGVLSSDLPVAATEGLPGAAGKVRMLGRALANERLARRQNSPVLTVWPTLGLLDARLGRPGEGERIVILHDPEPLRSQVGFDRFSKAWAAHAREGKRPTIMVHSPEAEAVTRALLPEHEVVLTLHPMLSPRGELPIKQDSGEVLVAGQFKPARDLELLEKLGPLLRGAGYRPRILGRGWPEIDGWEVTSRFVTEEELDAALSGAQVVLLPYSKYFQSGIAVRALELGTPTVGARTGFLEGLFGVAYPGCAGSSNARDYLAAVEATPSLEVGTLRRESTEAVDRSWQMLRGADA